MAGIPTVPGSEIDIATPPSAVHLNAHALAGPRMRGAEAIGGALDQISGEAGSLEANLQHARNATIAGDADIRMRAAQQAFTESTRGDTDEKDWVDRAQQMAAKVKDDIYASHDIPPSLRPQLNTELQSWGQTLQIHAETMANLQTVNRTTSTLYKSYQEAGRDTDAQGMMSAVKLGRMSKLDPVLMDQWEREIPKTVADTAIRNGLQTNPNGTLALLKSGASLPVKDAEGHDIVPKKVFSAKEMDAYTNTARVRTAQWQKSNFETMLQNDTDDVTGYISDDTIRAKIKSGEIEPRAGDSLIATQDRKIKIAKNAETREGKEEARAAAAEDTAGYHILMTRVHDNDAWQVQPEVYAASLTADTANIANKVHRAQAITEINNKLGQVKKAGAIQERPIETDIFQRGKKAFAQGLFRPTMEQDVTETVSNRHWYQLWAVSDKETKVTGTKEVEPGVEPSWQTTAPLHIRVQAMANYAKWQDQMRQYFKDNPKASSSEAQAYSQQLMSGHVDDQVKRALSGAQYPGQTDMKLSQQDQKALDWANNHPDDPRAHDIFARIMKITDGK